MLSKLIKHEFRATFRLLIPLFIILFILSIVDRIVLSLDIFHGVLEIIPILITFAFVISIATVIIATFILMIMRFYKNLTSDEGYLMFTLPVHTRQLIHSKFLVFFTWTIACILAVIAALLIALARPESISELWNSFKQVLKGLNNAMEGYGTLFIVETIVLILVNIIYQILAIYTSIAIGQLFNGHRLIASFGAYICIYLAMQVIMTIFIFTVSLVFKNDISNPKIIAQLLFPFITLFNLVMICVYYFTTNYIFTKRLNLE
jgi:hypothetical protein